MILLVSTPAFAAGQQVNQELTIPRVESRPIIDGRLDDSVWRQAAVLDEWFQTDPGDNAPPYGSTKAYLAYDASALYLAVVAHDRPGAIRYRMHERDNVVFQAQDWIGLNIDPTNTRRRAFSMAVNPIGVQGDGIQVEGSGFEEWDGIFQSAGKVDSGQYVVEIAIPFKSLRYPKDRNQRWGFSLTRHYGRDNAIDYPWRRSRDLACDLCQMITLTGIHDIGTAAAFEFNPSVVGHLAADRPSSLDRLGPSRTTSEFGANLKYGITSNLTLDGTWNPDFSQVEADAGQLQINNRFALFFPEKRPFFLEASDLFQTRFGLPGQDAGFTTPPVNIFYSRRVADPDGGLKLTGKVGKITIGALGALDAARDYDISTTIGGIAPAQLDPFAGDRVQVGVARMKVDVLSDGFVGASVTSRRFGGGRSVVGSLDSRFRIGANTTFRFLAARSAVDEPDLLGRITRTLGRQISDPTRLAAAIDSLPDEVRALDHGNTSGSALEGSFEYHDRHWNFGLGVLDITSGFETPLGFTPRTDYGLVAGYVAYTWQSTGFFRQIQPKIRFEDGYDHPAGGKLGRWDQHTDRLVSSFIDFKLPGATDFSFGYTRAFFKFEGVDFPGLDRGFLFLSTQLLKGFDLFLFVRGGEEAVFRDVVESGPPLPSSFISGSLNLNLRPAPGVRIGLDLTTARVWRRTDLAERESRYAESAIPRVKAQVQLTRRLGLRLIGEYRFDQFFERSGRIAEKRVSFATDALATYLIYPGQSVQLGWSTIAQAGLDLPLQTVARGGVAKVTYLWRF